jgi:glycosyltransferase involved in cell wall biosynthesis
MSTRPLRVAIYYPWLYLTSGAERTVLEIARRSRHQVTIFTHRYEPDATFPELRDEDVRVLGKVSVRRSVLSVASAAMAIAARPIDLADFDVLLVVCEGLGDLVVLRSPNRPALCLCLTPLRMVFDPVYRERDLSRRGRLERWAVRLASPLFRALDRLAWRRYSHVFAISEEVRGRICAGKLAEPSNVEVLHPGVDTSRFRPSSTKKRFFYLPGRIMWTKNLELGIRAFQLFLSKVEDPDAWGLRIAGMVDEKSQAYADDLRRLARGNPAIEFLIRPSDKGMRAGYAECFATLFTAFNEDWGLVIIESMACGKPVVAVDRGGPREIVRHNHDGLLAPADPEAMARCMLDLAQDPGLWSRLAAAGPASAARFSWERFIDGLDARIEENVRHPASEAQARCRE